MKLNVEKELAALQKMTVDGLRAKYAEVFGEPSGSRHKDHLVKRIIWRMQANAEGGLSEPCRETRSRAAPTHGARRRIAGQRAGAGSAQSPRKRTTPYRLTGAHQTEARALSKRTSFIHKKNRVPLRNAVFCCLNHGSTRLCGHLPGILTTISDWKLFFTCGHL